MKLEFRHNQASQDLARSLHSDDRIHGFSTYPPLRQVEVKPAVNNFQYAIHIKTRSYNGNVRNDGGDTSTVKFRIQMWMVNPNILYR